MSNSIKFTKGRLKFSKRGAVVKLSASSAKELYKNAGGDCDVFLNVQNGILTASPKIPDINIPSVYLDKIYFMPQK